MGMTDLRSRIGKVDVLMVTLDALRLDVAATAFRTARTPFLAELVPGGWEERHTPGSFTYAAHAAFFAGFWPTPVSPGPRVRPFALRFAGSRSIDAATCVLEGDNIVEGLRRRGYYTLCIGGVGFFNKLNPLGSVFPDLFDESHWRPEFGVAHLHSTRHQVECTVSRLRELPRDRPLFIFLNVSAVHPPTHLYVRGAQSDSVETQVAALEYVDRHLAPLFDALQHRNRPGIGFLISDHGTAFGEDGYTGHRIGHPVVWSVPYAECSWEPQA
jgi:hypothetical protein